MESRRPLPLTAIRAHERSMAQALRLAKTALGATSPNPMVGALVVRDGRIIGRGYHRRAGAPHAEVEALRQAGYRARGALLYTTLEPCNHHGRTPPCCDAILAAGIAEVVAATADPNPITNGRGFRRLRAAGVRVVTGVLAGEARALNAPFFKAMETGLPYVIAKAGQSLDGKIATAAGDSRWITSKPARARGHWWRSHADAIVVGVNTVLEDDPRLTARNGLRRADRPVRVIVDSRLRTPLNARCAMGPPATVIATVTRPRSRAETWVGRGVEVLAFPPAAHGRVPLRRLFRALAARGLHTVLIEGGGELIAGALAERLVDRVVFFIAPKLLGGTAAPGSVGGAGIARLAEAVRLADWRTERIGPDLCVDAQVVYP